MWKKIKDYHEYEINIHGEVKRGSKILKNQIASNGYVQVNLCKKNKVKGFRIHRLLAQAFIDNIFNKSQVNHKDGNKQNNSLGNLEWVTPSENILHAIHVIKTKLSPRSNLGKFGKDHNRSKFFWLEYKDGSTVKYESGLELKRLTGFDHTTIAWARKIKNKSYTFVRGKMKGITVHFELVE